MGLLDDIGKQSGKRFDSSPYRGPEPEYTDAEFNAEVRRREAAAKKNRENLQKIKQESQDVAGSEAADLVGLSYDKSLNRPKQTLKPDGNVGLDYKPEEITDAEGKQRKVNSQGNIVPQPQGAISVERGKVGQLGQEDPNTLYRVERGQTDINDQGAKQARATPLGRVDRLTDSPDPLISMPARAAVQDYNKEIFTGAIQGLRAREDEYSQNIQNYNNQFNIIDKAPVPLTADGKPLPPEEEDKEKNRRFLEKADLLKKSREATQEKLKATKERNDLEKLQQASGYNDAFKIAVQKVREEGGDPETHPLTRAIREQYSKLQRELPEITPADTTRTTTGGNFMYNEMQASPQAQRTAGIMDQAKTREGAIRESIKAEVVKNEEEANSIAREARDVDASFNSVLFKRNFVAQQHDDALAMPATTPEEKARKIGVIKGLRATLQALDQDLDAKEPQTKSVLDQKKQADEVLKQRKEMLNKGADDAIKASWERAQQINNDQLRREQLANSKHKEVVRESAKKEIIEAKDDKTRAEAVQKQVQSGLLSQEEANEAIAKAPKGEQAIGYWTSFINQLERGSLAFNQRQTSGLYRMAAGFVPDMGAKKGVVADTARGLKEFFNNASDQAIENANWINNWKKTDQSFDATTFGQITKGISELPAQLAPILATRGLGKMAGLGPKMAKVAGGVVGYVSNIAAMYDESRQDIESSPRGTTMSEYDKHISSLKYAVPAAVTETVGQLLETKIGASIIKSISAKAWKALVIDLATSSAFEGFTEAGQQLWLNIVAKHLDKYDPERPLSREVIQSFIVAFAIGGIAPIGVSGTGYVLNIGQDLLNIGTLSKQRKSLEKSTESIPRGDWRSWAKKVDEAFDLDQGLAPMSESLQARSLDPSKARMYSELTNSATLDILGMGQNIDAQLDQAEASLKIGKSPQSKKDSLIAINELLAERAAWADAFHSENQARKALTDEIYALPDEENEDGYRPKSTALAVAKMFLGSPNLTDVEREYKIGNEPIFTKNTAGEMVLHPRLQNALLPLIPTLEPLMNATQELQERKSIVYLQGGGGGSGGDDGDGDRQTQEKAPKGSRGNRLTQQETDKKFGTPVERIAKFNETISKMSERAQKEYGAKIRIEEKTSGPSLRAYLAGNDVVIDVNLDKYGSSDAEYTQRAQEEEIKHVADFITAIAGSKTTGETPAVYYDRVRGERWNQITKAGEENQEVAKALEASARLYAPDIFKGVQGPVSIKTLKKLIEGKISEPALYSELLRQMMSKKLTESRIELYGAETKKMLVQIAQYLKGIVKAIKGLLPALRASKDGMTALGVENDIKQMQAVLDVLDGKSKTIPPPPPPPPPPPRPPAPAPKPPAPQAPAPKPPTPPTANPPPQNTPKKPELTYTKSGKAVSVTRDGETVTVVLTPEQEAEWNKWENIYKRAIKAGSRSAGYQWAAKKREITGELSWRERRDKEDREKGNYLGKKVGVNVGQGRVMNGVVTANPFGRVTVLLDNGDKITVDESSIVAPMKDKKPETKPEDPKPSEPVSVVAVQNTQSRLPFRSQVVPLTELVDIGGTPVQPRQRATKGDKGMEKYQAQTRRQAINLDPLKNASIDSTADQGAPVGVRLSQLKKLGLIPEGKETPSLSGQATPADGIAVLSGNGRSKGIIMADEISKGSTFGLSEPEIAKSKSGYERYQKQINAPAGQIRIRLVDLSFLENLEQAVQDGQVDGDLVAEARKIGLNDDQIRRRVVRRFVRDSNLSTGGMSSGETALQDAYEIAEDPSLGYGNFEQKEGDIVKPDFEGVPLAGNVEQLESWWRALGSNDSYKTRDGYTGEFIQRVKMASLAYLLSSKKGDLIETTPETQDLLDNLAPDAAKITGISNLADAIITALPYVTNASTKLAELGPDYARLDILKPIAAGLKAFRSARLEDKNVKWQDLVKQGVFAGMAESIPREVEIAFEPLVTGADKELESEAFEKGKGLWSPNSSTKMASYLSNFANSVYEMATRIANEKQGVGQAEMDLGADLAPSLDEKQVIEIAKYAYNKARTANASSPNLPSLQARDIDPELTDDTNRVPEQPSTGSRGDVPPVVAGTARTGLPAMDGGVQPSDATIPVNQGEPQNKPRLGEGTNQISNESQTAGREVLGGNPAGQQGSGVAQEPNGRTQPERRVVQSPWSASDFLDPNVPGYKSFSIFTPTAIFEEHKSALRELQNAVGKIDNFVADSLGLDIKDLYNYKGKSRFSAEQVASIALCIHQINQGRATLVGHEMGIGKGRIVAALMWYANRKGMNSIFVTKDPNLLYPAMLDDLEDIGAVDSAGKPLINPFITDSSLATTRKNGAPIVTDNKQPTKLKMVADLKKLPFGFNAMFTTYSQLAREVVQDASLAIAPNSIVVMDESHIGSGDSSSVGRITRRLSTTSKGVMYASATAIKRLDSVGAYFDKTSMQKAVATPDTLIELAQKFKNPFLEMLSKMLVKTGEMIRYQRGLTHEGEPVPFVARALKTGKAVAEANNAANEILGELKRVERGAVMANACADVAQQFGAYLKKVTGKTPESTSGDPYPLAGQFHNVANLMLLASKADETVEAIKETVESGRKAFVSLDTTNEAAVDDILRGDSEDGFNAPAGNYTDYMKRFVTKLHRITVTAEFPDGTKMKQRFSIAALPSFIKYTPAIQALQTQLLEQDRVIGGYDNELKTLPLSPVDYMRQKLARMGISSGEISGRQFALLENGERETRADSDMDRQKTLMAYNNSDTDNVLFGSRSSSTGLSAQDAYLSPKPRTHYFLQPNPDVTTFQQAFGRSHRTGQRSVPRIEVLYASEIPAERRIMTMVARKMALLGAATTGSSSIDTASQAGEDFLNRYGDVAVANIFIRDPVLKNEFQTRTSINLGNTSEQILSIANSAPPGEYIKKLLHSTLILNIEDARSFFEQLDDEFESLVSFAKVSGSYDLESETSDFKATLLSEKDGMSAFTPDASSEFGKPAKIARYRFDNPTPSPTFVEISGSMEQAKKDAQQQASQFMQAIQTVEEKETTRIQTSRMAEGNKAPAITKLLQSLKNATYRVDRAKNLVGSPIIYTDREGRQTPAVVTGLLLNMKWPQFLNQQYVIIQTPGFSNKIRVPLDGTVLDRANPVKAELNNAPMEADEADAIPPYTEVNVLGGDTIASVAREMVALGGQLVSYQTKALVGSGYQFSNKSAMLLAKRYATSRGVNILPTIEELEMGLYKDGEGNGVLVMKLFPDTSARVSATTIQPARAREMSALVREGMDPIKAYDTTEILDLSKGGSQITEREYTEDKREEFKQYMESIPDNRKFKNIGQSYDRSRQLNADHWVITGNLISGAKLSQLLFGSQLPLRLVKFTNKNGGDTTGIVVPEVASGGDLVRVNDQIELAEKSGLLKDEGRQALISLLRSTIGGETEVAVMSDGSVVSFNSKDITIDDTPTSAGEDSENPERTKSTMQGYSALSFPNLEMGPDQGVGGAANVILGKIKGGASMWVYKGKRSIPTLHARPLDPNQMTLFQEEKPDSLKTEEQASTTPATMSQIPERLWDIYREYFPTQGIASGTSKNVFSLIKQFINEDSLAKGLNEAALVDIAHQTLLDVLALVATKPQIENPAGYVRQSVANALKKKISNSPYQVSLDAPSGTRFDEGADFDENAMDTQEDDGSLTTEDRVEAGTGVILDPELRDQLEQALSTLGDDIKTSFIRHVYELAPLDVIAKERGLKQGGVSVIKQEIEKARTLLDLEVKRRAPALWSRMVAKTRKHLEDGFSLSARQIDGANRYGREEVENIPQEGRTPLKELIEKLTTRDSGTEVTIGQTLSALASSPDTPAFVKSASAAIYGRALKDPEGLKFMGSAMSLPVVRVSPSAKGSGMSAFYSPHTELGKGFIGVIPEHISPGSGVFSSVLLHEIVHAISVQLVTQEIPELRKTRGNRAKIKAALEAYAVKPLASEDNKGGAHPAVRSLIKAYMTTLESVKDPNGRPISNAVFGSGEWAAYDLQIPFTKYSDPTVTDGIYIEGYFDPSNTRAMIDFLVSKGLNGSDSAIPADLKSTYARLDDFVVTTGLQMGLAGMEDMAASEEPQPNSVVITPRGLEKLRAKGITPTFYSTATFRAEKPIFSARISSQGKSVYYGLSDPFEFLSETFSNPRFIGAMSKISNAPIELSQDMGGFYRELAEIVDPQNPALAEASIRGNMLGAASEVTLSLADQNIGDYILGKSEVTEKAPQLIQPTLLARQIQSIRDNIGAVYTATENSKHALITTSAGSYHLGRLPNKNWKVLSIEQDAIRSLGVFPGLLRAIESIPSVSGEVEILVDGSMRVNTSPTDSKAYQAWRKMAGISDESGMSVRTPAKNKFIAKYSELRAKQNKTQAEINLMGAIENMGRNLGWALTPQRSGRSTWSDPVDLLKVPAKARIKTKQEVPYTLQAEPLGGPKMVQQSLFARELEPDNRTGSIPAWPNYNDPENPIPEPAFPYDSSRPDSLSPQLAYQLLWQLQYGSGIIPEELSQKIQQAQEEARGRKQIGRPDLANPGGTNDEARTVVNAVDEYIKPFLTSRPDELVERRAKILLENEDKLIETILNKDRQPRVYGNMTDDETRAGELLVQKLAPKALVGSPEEVKKVGMVLKAYRRLRGEVGRALRIMADKKSSPYERHLEFITATVFTPRGKVALKERLRKAREQSLGDMSDNTARDDKIRFLVDQLGQLNEALQEQKARAEQPAQDEQGQPVEQDPELQRRIAELESLVQAKTEELESARLQLSEQERDAETNKQSLALVHETLGKLGTSMEKLLFETSLAMLRTPTETNGKPNIAKQMFDEVQMTRKEREAVEKIVLEYDARAVSKDTGVSMERIGELLEGLRGEASRRFERLSKQGMTRTQLRNALRANAETGASLMAREADPFDQPLTPEEAMEEIYRAYGFRLNPTAGTKMNVYDRKGKTNLFDLRKKEHAFILARAITSSDPTADSALMELYASALFSGLITQVVNVAPTTASWAYLPLLRGFETAFSYATNKILKVQVATGGSEENNFNSLVKPVLGSPYETAGSAVRGWYDEAKSILRAAIPSATLAYSYFKLAWETEAGFFMSQVTGEIADDPIARFGGERGVARMVRQLPTKTFTIPDAVPYVGGKTVEIGGRTTRASLRLMLAADEFSKAFRAGMQVGAIAYRIGRAKGLRGAELESYIEKETSGQWMDDASATPSQSWIIASARANKETLTSQVENIADKKSINSIGSAISAVGPGSFLSANRFVADLRERMSNTETRSGRIATLPVRLLAALAQTFSLIIKTPTNMAREGLASTALAIPNLAVRFRTQSEGEGNSRSMSPEDYELFIRRGGQAMVGLVTSLLLHGASEGDDDDDKKYFLITGSPDKTPGQGNKTRFRNTPYVIRIGGTTIDYSRYEPLATALSATVDTSRNVKQATRTGSAAGFVGDMVSDVALAPLTKTYGKQWRDLLKIFRPPDARGVPGVASVARDRLQVMVSWPLWRKLQEAFDPYVRDVGLDPLSKEGLLYTISPTLAKPNPRRDYEGNPIKKEGTAMSRLFVPGQGVYKNQKKTKLESFISRYNAVAQKPWLPDGPSRTFENPITGRREQLTSEEYDRAMEISRVKIRDFLFNNLSDADIENPTEKKKDELQNGISNIYRASKQAFIQSRASRQARETTGVGETQR
jgi:hypothetical protein